MARTSPARRRRRSVRLTLASALLLCSTVAVALTAVVAGRGLLLGAAVFSCVAGWAALRIVAVELRDSRRAGLGAQAAAARDLTTALTEQANAYDAQRVHAEVALGEARTDVARLARHARFEADRRAVAEQRLADLAAATGIRDAERADELASWNSADPSHAEEETVVDLLAWEDRNRRGTEGRARRQA